MYLEIRGCKYSVNTYSLYLQLITAAGSANGLMCVATGYVRPNARRLGAVGQHKGLATLCLTFHVPNTVLQPTQLSGGRAKKRHSHAAILMKSSICPLPGVRRSVEASSASHACVEASTAANVLRTTLPAQTENNFGHFCIRFGHIKPHTMHSEPAFHKKR